MGHRQLVLIRQFFEEARRAPVTESPFLAMKGLLGLDLCVELTFNLIINDHGTAEQHTIQRGNKTTWYGLAELTEKILRAKNLPGIPHARQLETLHKARNLAQHSGIGPHARDVRDFVEPVRAFLDFAAKELFGSHFERLREWDALENPDLKQWFAECAILVESSRPDFAIACVMIAYRRIASWLRETVAPRRGGVGLDTHHLRGVPGVSQIVKQLEDAATDQEAGLVAVSLGFSIAEHYRFLRAGAGIHANVMMSGDIDVVRSSPWRDNPDHNQGEADFALNYLGRAALYMESTFPSVFDGKTMPTKLSAQKWWVT